MQVYDVTVTITATLTVLAPDSETAKRAADAIVADVERWNLPANVTQLDFEAGAAANGAHVERVTGARKSTYLKEIDT